MDQEQISRRNGLAATRADSTMDVGRLARELGRLLGKFLAEQSLNGNASGLTERVGVNVECEP